MSTHASVSEPSTRMRASDFVAHTLMPFVVEALEQARSERGPTEAAIVAFAHEAYASASPLADLAERCGLDDRDVALLALAAGPYLHARIARTCRELHAPIADERLSVGLALQLLGVDAGFRFLALERFEPDRPLFRDGLLTLDVPIGARGDALVDRVIGVPQRTLDRLLGWPRLDDALRPYCVLERIAVDLNNVILPERARESVLSLVRHHDRYREAVRRLGFARAIPYGRGITLLFAGPPGTGKTLFTRALAHSLGRTVLRVHADRLAEADTPIEPLVLALLRDASLTDAVLFFDECEALFSKRSSKLGCLLAELERFEGICVLATNAPQQIDDAMDRRIVARVDFEIPDALDRQQIWELHLPPEAPIADDVDLPLLASLFAFSGGAIKNAVLVALNRAIDRNPDAPVLDMATLRSAAESQLKFNLEDLAHKSTTSLGLADLVLPPGECAKVEEVIAACRHKEWVQNKWGFGRRLLTGKGICVLFDGPPGTGKTLCAEILAGVLDKAVYRINVANVMSKWMGETEKNIAQIFQRAKATQAILLFDEADSLFARRTEVQTSNDRFANQEVNLLLQEVERFDGIVVLTTNFFGGLDDALKRRIQYRVTFPKPGIAERKKIWRTLIPRDAPLAPDVDLEDLARAFDFSGGNIKNAVLRAAYRAAGDGDIIHMSHLVDASRRESEAAGMLFREISSTPKSDGLADLSIDQLEKLVRVRAEWEAEGVRLLGPQFSVNESV